MIDLTTYTDDDLDVLRVAVLTEQERRQRIATALALVWADLTDRVGPGKRVIWTDGNIYRNTSRAWLHPTTLPGTPA